MAKAKKKKQHEEALDMIETTGASETADTPEAEEQPMLEITPDDVRLIEAILFASSSSVSEAMIAERFPADRVSLIPDILEQLKEQYAARGVTLVQRDKRWALRTAVDLGDQLRLEKEQPKKFTRAAMETMAIVAYHQPVTRAEIENIRGVATSPGSLDALMEAGWIKPGKRREVPGRPVTWLSTQVFLDHFGLEKLEDLPGMDDLKAAGLLDKRPAIEAMPTADLFGEGKEEEDPNEITDEDLIGKSDIEGEEAAYETIASSAGGEDDEEEADDSDEDEDEDEDSDEEASDEDDDDDDDDDYDDEDDEDDEDEDSDDEDEEEK